MAGIKVTLLRIRPDGPSNVPMERLFEDADDWTFIHDHNIRSLLVMKNNKPYEDGSFTRSTIAEFPAGVIESVEFA